MALSETDQKLRQLALKGLEKDSSQETVDALNNVLARQGKSLASLGIDITPEPVPEPAPEEPREPVGRVSVRELRRTPDRPAAPAQAPEVQRDVPETTVQNLEVRQILADISNEISIPQPEVSAEDVVADEPPVPKEPKGRVGIQELRRVPDRPAAPGERPAVAMDRPVVDTIVEAPVDVIDPYSMPEDPTVDPLPLVLDMPPTDTQVNNVAVLETMGRLAEGQDAGIANTYEQAKADAEFNSDAVKAKFTEFLTTFNRQTTEAIVGEADPEIVADKIQEDAAIEQSIIAPYMGAVVKAYPNVPRGIQEKTAARYYAMGLLAEYMKDYNGWDIAGDIAVSMIPGVALTDVIQSGVKPEMVEAVKQLSAEDQARFYTALLTQLNEAYDADKTFVAGVFEAFPVS